MGSKVSKGTANIYVNDLNNSVTFEWTLHDGMWSRYLSSDRLWNWWSFECCFESPPFVTVLNRKSVRFRLGLKESCQDSPPALIAYAKCNEMEAFKNAFWQIFVGCGSEKMPLDGFRRPLTKPVEGVNGRRFLFLEFGADSLPDEAALTISLTLFRLRSAPASYCSLNSLGCGKNFSISDARALWRTNLTRLKPSPAHLVDDESPSKCDPDDVQDEDAHYDVTLVVENGVRFDAHRCILVCQSPVFEAMFSRRGNFKEARERNVFIRDISAESMVHFLSYFYTGDVDLALLNQAAESKTTGDYSKSVPYRALLKAADEYDVHGLKILCEVRLSAQVTAENVYEFMALADQYSGKFLKDKCLRYVKAQETASSRAANLGKLARRSSAIFKGMYVKLF